MRLEKAATGPAEKHPVCRKDQPSDEGAGDSQNYGGPLWRASHEGAGTGDL